jgi:hypothetical protein
MLKKFLAAIAAVVFLSVGLAACSSDADVASKNLSKAADNFEVNRQIIFYNGITGAYVAEVDGLCSVGNHDDAGKLSVTCKVGPDQYIKNYLGLSDNVTWFALQTSPVRVSTSHYRVILKPSEIVPDFDVR